MSKSLVIVESPAKARTIARFLGKDFVVESSIGHIRDLPRRASDVPERYKKTSWGRLGVDIENDFRPLYVLDPDKKQHIGKLRSLLKQADELLLATDEDREGESIAWHLLEVLEPKVPVKRMVFHEITRRAIQEAIKNPRSVDRRLVEAQEARRILDRLYGYEVSPVLWKKVMPRLSAGRVQSVATRIVVERERARMRFRTARYWGVEGQFVTRSGEARFTATLSAVNAERVATGKDFDENGALQKEGVVLIDGARAEALVQGLSGVPVRVRSIERKPNRRSPSPPFMTSTLQQEAGRKLRFSAARTMQTAQRLYENGHITYMRTDSTTLSPEALNAARAQIQKLYGAEYLPKQPRTYRNKVKNAQEAHEAIRPTGDVFRHPDEVKREVGHDEARIYELVWMRTIASQMEDARGESVSVKLSATTRDGEDAEFSVSGNTIVFPGFLRAYVEGTDDPEAELETRENPLPPLTEGEAVDARALVPKEHETQPPARFTEASLVRRLEELGVGRPSTYASILSTIQQRGYVWNRGSALVPSFTAFAVVTLLERHFGDLVDYAFTARMEDDLDAIAQGAKESLPWLKRFYFGSQDPANENAARSRSQSPASQLDRGLHSLVSEQLGVIDARAINSIVLGRNAEGADIVVRVGRFGAYLQCGEATASLPDDQAPDELSIEKAQTLLDAPSSDRVLGTDPKSGLPVLLKNGRFGAYVQLGDPEPDDKEKPKRSSLLSSMKPEGITLEDALELLSLPRPVGTDPADGKLITAQLGRYGPYLSKGTDSRSLDDESMLFSVTLDQALALFAAPRRGRRRAAAEPIKELGVDQVSGKTITLREGRFGLYVTDGETNASLRKGDSVDEVNHARAMELLQTRRERAPVKIRGRQTKTTKKAATKKKSPQTASALAAKEKGTKKRATGKRATKKKASPKSTRPTASDERKSSRAASTKRDNGRDGAAGARSAAPRPSQSAARSPGAVAGTERESTG